MKNTYDTIMLVRATASKNEKLAILEKNKDDADLREFLRVCYEPRINFYQSKVDMSQVSDVKDKFQHTTFGRELLAKVVDQLNGRKVTGNEAKWWLADLYSRLNADWERELLSMLIERDVKAGFSESTINKVWADTVTDIPYMRCSLPKDAKVDTFPWGDGVFSQIKADGMFANVTRNHDGSVRIESRNGSPFPLDQLTDLVNDVVAHVFTGYQIHGELLVARNGEVLPRQEGNGMLNKVLKGGELPTGCVVLYDAWDLIPLDRAVTKGKWTLPYKERFKNLAEMLKSGTPTIRLIETKIVHSFQRAQSHYQEALARGLEGTIIKHPEMEWKDGTSKHQVKMKLEFEVELKVVGYNEGTGKAAGSLGSLQCESACGKLKVNVGSGFTDKMRADIWARKDLNVITAKSNSIMPPENKDTYSLFLPIFLEERLDKREADSLERIQAQFEAATR